MEVEDQEEVSEAVAGSEEGGVRSVVVDITSSLKVPVDLKICSWVRSKGSKDSAGLVDLVVVGGNNKEEGEKEHG